MESIKSAFDGMRYISVYDTDPKPVEVLDRAEVEKRRPGR